MNPLFQAMSGKQNGMGNIMQLMNMLKSGNPQQMAQQMMMSNPQFRQFVEANKGKTPQQVARENGIDLDQLRGMMK